ncbi:HIT family protein [Litoreibacter janthinus]|uniref:Diadenosine tetraphosphate (Ap4A) hydrolase n=1 Tax=Litoreibacter janthinus TaxID=670154 RepID=A0A1I6HRT8_9RHOB|nr:HIT family protein [Litoreibacter janthinus]SFR57181.1 Diadenosine tetraphosphate (Ap4A) hydrolase [Litoreibacter janthinus]
MESDDIFEKFDAEQMKVFETNFWMVVVRHKQITLGSCVAICKRQISSFSDLSADECEDLQRVYSKYEGLCGRAFGAKQFNYLALMMKDPHLHFHMIPRYPEGVHFEGEDWRDESYPKLVSMKHPLVDIEVRKKIRSALAEAI